MTLQRLLNRRQPPARRRVAIIGLDCAAPELVFDRWPDQLPTLTRLRHRGLYGPLESVIPAITVPAWSCMMSGKDPGTLGVYGFRNRKDHSYHGLAVANSLSIREPRLWDILSAAGRRSIVLGVPQTYPPRPLKGQMVSCFLTPDTTHEYTFPPALRDSIAAWVDSYQVDVKGFRTTDKAWLRDQIHRMTRARFQVARQLTRAADWDFFIMVEIGVDRMHHGFWKDLDPAHRQHDPDSPFKDAILDYYRMVDSEIAGLLQTFDDNTLIFVVSDHGAKKMDGGICLNEWLIQQGYLVLAEPPDLSSGPVRFDQLQVDWSRTRAWGDGGYYGRVFINLEGREPQGIVPASSYDALRDELAARLEALGDERGQSIATRCFRPESLYHRVRGVPPDLLVYFGDLAWRSIGSVGWNAIHVFDNDTGPDDANHAQFGMLIYADPRRDLGGQPIAGMHLMQIAPTVLTLLGLPVPNDMQKPPISAITSPYLR